MNKFFSRKQAVHSNMSSLKKVETTFNGVLTGLLAPSEEDIKRMFNEYFNTTSLPAITPVRYSRENHESSLNFPEYRNYVRRHEVKEMIKVGPYLVTLNTAKVAHVYNRFERNFVGILNSDIRWDIKTLMHNFTRNSIIVIYVKQTLSRRKSIQCCEVKVKDFSNLQDKKSFRDIFATEEILYPGYIEFDEPTKMAVTKTSNPPTLKIWSLKDYSLMFSLPPDDAQYAFEVRFAQGLVILIKKTSEFNVNFDIIDPDSGTLLKKFWITYNPIVPLSWIEFFDPFIIFKQEHDNARLFNVVSEESIVSIYTQKFEPESFVFLPNNLIMAMYKDKIEIRSHSLKLLSTIKVPKINYFSKNNNTACNICIDTKNELIFSIQERSSRAIIKRSSIKENITPFTTGMMSK